MEDVIPQFEKDFKAWLENMYTVSDEQNQVKKLNDIEKTADDFCGSLHSGN